MHRSRSERLVSVIIPTFNRKAQVLRAIESVLDQTYRNLECIVVDDNSTDETVTRVLELSKRDARVRVLAHDRNLHVSAARNTGLADARGQYIAFLDDDDTWLATKLEKQVKVLESSPTQVGLVYCWFDIYEKNVRVGARQPRLRGEIFDQLILSQPLGNASTLVVRREVLDAVGGFDDSLRRGNDGDFIRRVALQFEIDYVAEVLVHYHVENEGNPRITSNTRSGLEASIVSHEVKLRKFGERLDERQEIKALLLIKIARLYGRLGNLMAAIGYVAKARDLGFPLSQTYLSVAKIAYDFSFRRVRK